jgi:formate hydrogenlyase subunit 6/NADH:ubiquinone oxidoreductase subunit I
MKVCPTNVLQPAAAEGGVEGLWTPVMNYRVGFCQTNCTACSQVCPTGAIQPISVNRKLGLGEHKADGPIRLGTAHYDLGRCLPWANNVPCLVCEEVCPVSPKAIYSVPQRFLVRDGHKRVAAVEGNTIRLVEAGEVGSGAPVRFEPNQFRGDQTRHFYLEIVGKTAG